MYTSPSAHPWKTPLKYGLPAGGSACCATIAPRYPPHILRNIMAIIEARSDEITEKWKGYFGELRYFC